MQRRFLVLLLAAGSLPISPAVAADLTLLGGGVRANSPRESSYAWVIDWKHPLREHLAVSATWINEGHVTNHHRDGAAVQGWLQTQAFGGRLTLGAGVGPYIYFDTTRLTTHEGAVDDHGWGLIYSLGASWNLGNAWLLQLLVNETNTRRSFDTTSVLLGVGYRFDQVEPAPLLAPRSVNEITLSPGLTIANNFESQKGFAKAVEYRRSLGQNVAVSGMWLDEGKSDAVRRNGIAAQLWLSHPLNSPNWMIAAGLGPYYSFKAATDAPGDDVEVHHWSALVTLATVYWFRADSGVRFSWSRVATDDARDTDVFLLGLAYRF